MTDTFELLSKQNQSEFDHKYACWANNHNGWQKMKRRNTRHFLAMAHQSFLEMLMVNLREFGMVGAQQPVDILRHFAV